MKVKLDNKYNKIVYLPLVMADDCPEDYKCFNKKTLFDLADDIYVEDLHVYHELKGMVLEFKDPIKPNVFFKWSNAFEIDRFENDEDYKWHCQIYYWVDEYGAHIRFAKPYIEGMLDGIMHYG